MEHNIIELSNRYDVVVGDYPTYTVCKLEPNGTGGWRRSAGKICKNADQLFDTLLHCELSQDDIDILKDVQQVVQNIKAELRAVIERNQSYESSI